MRCLQASSGHHEKSRSTGLTQELHSTNDGEFPRTLGIVADSMAERLRVSQNNTDSMLEPLSNEIHILASWPYSR